MHASVSILADHALYSLDSVDVIILGIVLHVYIMISLCFHGFSTNPTFEVGIETRLLQPKSGGLNGWIGYSDSNSATKKQ